MDTQDVFGRTSGEVHTFKGAINSKRMDVICAIQSTKCDDEIVNVEEPWTHFSPNTRLIRKTR